MTNQYQYNKIIKYLVTMKCDQPLHIGSMEGDREEMLLHPVTGRPFLQGSGMIGAIREYCQNNFCEEITEFLFGNDEQSSKIKITDGIILSEQYKTELRPHIRISGGTGTVDEAGIREYNTTDLIKSGQKYALQYVAAGEEFTFMLYYFGKQGEKFDAQSAEIIENCLNGIHRGQIQFGARKSIGCGTFTILSAKRKTFDLLCEEGRKGWVAEEDIEEGYEDRIKQFQDGSGCQYQLEMNAKVNQGILVKSILSIKNDKGTSIAVGIKNGRKQYILPGTSLKGVVRNRVEMIAAYLGLEKNICEFIFGTEAEKNNQGFMGNAYFYDSVIENPKDMDQARIHIDKFTGGTFDGGLFQERLVCGDLRLRIHVKDGKYAKRGCALLLLAMRDIALKQVGFGSGAAVGHGFLDIIDYSFRMGGQEATVHWNSKKKIYNEQMFLECLSSLRMQEEST